MTAPHHDPAVARLIEQARAEGAAEALRSAADKVMSHAGDGAVRLVTVRRWLLDRADQIGGAL